MDPYFGQFSPSGASYYNTVGWPTPITSASGMDSGAYAQSFSFGGIVEDLGDWIKTTGGEVLRVVVDEFGRRIVSKTGEILSGTPVGTSTVYHTASNQLSNPMVLLGIGAVAMLLLARR